MRTIDKWLIYNPTDVYEALNRYNAPKDLLELPLYDLVDFDFVNYFNNLNIKDKSFQII